MQEGTRTTLTNLAYSWSLLHASHPQSVRVVITSCDLSCWRRPVVIERIWHQSTVPFNSFPSNDDSANADRFECAYNFWSSYLLNILFAHILVVFHIQWYPRGNNLGARQSFCFLWVRDLVCHRFPLIENRFWIGVWVFSFSITGLILILLFGSALGNFRHLKHRIPSY